MGLNIATSVHSGLFPVFLTSAQILHGFGKSVTSVTSPQNRPKTRMDARFRRLQLSVTQRNLGYATSLSYCFY